uniref:Uncharacterized protein n=1 Tax=Oryza barthii TaxID=65489 RepID=A0A0D3F1K8_9ORYZ
MEVEHLSPSRWRGSAASAAVPDVARARALLPHGGRLRYRVITIQLRFDDQDAMLDDTLTLKLLVQVVGHGGGVHQQRAAERGASILARLETDTVE